MKRDSCVFYRSLYEGIMKLETDQQKLDCFMAFFEYALDGIEPDSDGVVGFMFKMVKPAIDANNRKYEGNSKGGKKKKEVDSKSNEVDGKSNEVTDPNMLNDKCEMLNDDEKKKEKRVRAAFVKPTVEEVRAYCLERENKVDPESFVNFYESKGWKIGNSAMKDWKAAVRTWEKRETKAAAPKARQPSFQNQRTYDFDKLEQQLLRRGYG